MERAASTRVLVAMGMVLPALLACNEHPLVPVEMDNSVERKETVVINPNKNVDILFVVDNSGSMGEEQATLAANFSSFIEVLEDPEVSANYRIGITTTDNGNPWCSGTTPEGGALVMSSCQDRLQDFVFRPGDPSEVDKRTEACGSLCPSQLAGLAVVPTSLGVDDTALPRPWLERFEGSSNLPQGVSTTQGFQCFGPQGINGCGFESPLESMYKALKRSEDSEQPSWGFLRDDALLGVVFVTDEADCSYQVENQDAFLPEAGRHLWTDPDAPYPSSGVCWNAGVACDGGPGRYDDCRPENHGVDGVPGATDDDAVLHPLSRYLDLLRDVDAGKVRARGGPGNVLVSVIAGVPDGYPGQAVQYQDSPDPGFQGDYGIGPGCSSAAGEAVPPVRLRQFADDMGEGAPNMFSICNSDYREALEEIAGRIRDKLVPACMPMCVRDADPTTTALDSDCVLSETVGNGAARQVARCERDGDRFAVPAGEDQCFFERSGDELDEYCQTEGWNLEFKVLRREGTRPAPGSLIEATCQASPTPSVDCPELI